MKILIEIETTNKEQVLDVISELGKFIDEAKAEKVSEKHVEVPRSDFNVFVHEKV